MALLEERHNICVLCDNVTNDLISYGLSFLPILFEMLRYKKPEQYYILEFDEENETVVRWDWEEDTHSVVKTKEEKKIVFK